MNSTAIRYFGQVSSSGFGAVFISWAVNAGNYDLSHYTVQLLVDNITTLTVVVSAENTEFPVDPSTSTINTGSTPAVILAVPINREVNATITTTSRCGQTSIGVTTKTITSSGK